MFVAPITLFLETCNQSGIAATALAFGDSMFGAPPAAVIVFIMIVVVVGFILGNRCRLSFARTSDNESSHCQQTE